MELLHRVGEGLTPADAVFDEISFEVSDLTTPGSFWLNPPLPMDAHGNLYGSARSGGGTVDVDPPRRK